VIVSVGTTDAALGTAFAIRVTEPMQTHANPPVASLVPPPLASLDAVVRSAGRRQAAVAACTDLERWLAENPLEVRPSVERNTSASSLPPVDWLARLTSITPPPKAVVLDNEPLLEATLGQAHEIAWAIVLAVQYVSVECSGRVRFEALRQAANALFAIEPTARRALASTTLDILDGDRASRAVREALVAVGFAENLAEEPTSLRTIAVAAMAQAFLDDMSEERALTTLRAEVTRDTRCVPDVVTAYEALCIRRGHPPDDSPLHARLVALACEEARLSLIEGRASLLSLGIGLADAIELDSSELVNERPSVDLPPTSEANGTSTLAKIPLPHVVATLNARKLSASVVLTDAADVKHVLVFKDGDLEHVHSHASLATIAMLPDETEIAFFWDRDLLEGRGERSRRAAAEVLLSIARRWNRTQMRREIEALGTTFVVHATVEALSPTDEERRLVQRWNVGWLVGRTIDLRYLTGELSLPLAYALIHLGEAHPPSNRCRVCRNHRPARTTTLRPRA